MPSVSSLFLQHINILPHLYVPFFCISLYASFAGHKAGYGFSHPSLYLSVSPNPSPFLALPSVTFANIFQCTVSAVNSC